MIRRSANLVLFCIAAALCYGMQVSKPHYADLTGPIPVYGRIGETVDARGFSLKVEKVAFARKLKTSAFGAQKVLTTGGVWAIVTAEIAAGSTSTTIWGGIWKGPTGLRYDTTERLLSVPGAPPYFVEPGLPKKVRFVFEFPTDQANGATLLVSNARFFALDSEARITLGGVTSGGSNSPTTMETFDLDQPI